MRKLISCLLMVCLLSSCGFRLRGTADLPKWLNQVAVISEAGNFELVAALKSRLDSYGIALCDDPVRASFLLIIERSDYQMKIISVGASTNPRQYQMILATSYRLQNHKGQIIKTPSVAIVNRQLTVNNDRILGSSDEENTLLREMRQDTVTQIINKISRD